MDAIKEFCVSVCAAAVLCAISSGIFDGGRYAGVMKIIASAVLICALISGFPKISFSFPKTELAAEENSEELCGVISEQTKALTEKFCAQMVLSQLLQDGIPVTDVEIKADISEQGSITITEAVIVTENETDVSEKKKAEEKVKTLLSVNGENIEIK